MDHQTERPEPAPQTIDPMAKTGAIAVALGRIGIGIGAMAFTRPALGVLGFDNPDGATVALARLAGGRDIALGLHALAALDDRERLKEATLLGALVDAGDAAAFATALADRDGIDATAIKNMPIALSAVAAGGWIFSRLAR